MINEENLIKQGYLLVYDLKTYLINDPNSIKNTHKVTLDNTTTMGLKGDKGLYATQEWWENIEKGLIEQITIIGTINDIDIDPDYPLFDSHDNMITVLREDNKESMYAGVMFTDNEAADAYSYLYQVGNRVVIYFILDKLKLEDAWNSTIDKLGVLPMVNKIYIQP